MEIDRKNLVEQYGRMVATIAHRMIQNKEIAKEAAQEVWYEIFKSLSSLMVILNCQRGYIRLRNGLFYGMLKMKR